MFYYANVSYDDIVLRSFGFNFDPTCNFKCIVHSKKDHIHKYVTHIYHSLSRFNPEKMDVMGNVNIKLQVQDGFTLEFAGGVLPIEKFRSRDIRPRGTQTSEKRGQSSVLHRVFGLSGGFVERVGTFRLPLEKKFGPSTGHMMQNDTVIEQMDKTISESFEKRIEVEINRILAGL